jgi:hypothetical protein
MRRLLVLALLAGCSTAPAAPPEIPNAKRIDPSAVAPLRLFHAETLLGPSDADATPAVRFDLSNARGVQRAVLRFRRAFEQTSERKGPYPITIQVTNVNKGLRVLRHEDGRILEAEPTEREADVWSGLQVPRYGAQSYADYLRGMNATMSTRLLAGAAWDDIDVTQMVRDEAAGDRSITLLISTATVAHLRWEDPHLLVQAGAVTTPKVPAKGTAKLSIRSTPAPAKIYVDGEFVGTTVDGAAVDIPVSGDRVKLRLEKKGFKPWEETVRLSGDVPIHAELEAE